MPSNCDDEPEVIAMYAEGLSIRAIMRKTERSYSRTHRVLRNAGVLRPPGANTTEVGPDEVRRVVDTYTSGKGILQTADTCGLSRWTVRSIVKNAGLLRQQGRPPRKRDQAEAGAAAPDAVTVAMATARSGGYPVVSRWERSLRALAKGRQAELLLALRQAHPAPLTQRQLAEQNQTVTTVVWRTLHAAERVHLIDRRERPEGSPGWSRFEWTLTPAGIAFTDALRSTTFQHQ